MSATRTLTNAPLNHPNIVPCFAAHLWTWDGVRFEVLGPVLLLPTDTNNGSCVLHITAPQAPTLLPGDIENVAEKALVNRLDTT